VLVTLLLVNGWCVFLWHSQQALPSPVAVGVAIGALWGYGLGLLALRRTCQLGRST
jgi:uncharacterized RDD family membrane protein YckC